MEEAMRFVIASVTVIGLASLVLFAGLLITAWRNRR